MAARLHNFLQLSWYLTADYIRAVMVSDSRLFNSSHGACHQIILQLSWYQKTYYVTAEMATLTANCITAEMASDYRFYYRCHGMHLTDGFITATV